MSITIKAGVWPDEEADVVGLAEVAPHDLIADRQMVAWLELDGSGMDDYTPDEAFAVVAMSFARGYLANNVARHNNLRRDFAIDAITATIDAHDRLSLAVAIDDTPEDRHDDIREALIAKLAEAFESGSKTAAYVLGCLSSDESTTT